MRTDRSIGPAAAPTAAVVAAAVVTEAGLVPTRTPSAEQPWSTCRRDGSGGHGTGRDGSGGHGTGRDGSGGDRGGRG